MPGNSGDGRTAGPGKNHLPELDRILMPGEFSLLHLDRILIPGEFSLTPGNGGDTIPSPVNSTDWSGCRGVLPYAPTGLPLSTPGEV